MYKKYAKNDINDCAVFKIYYRIKSSQCFSVRTRSVLIIKHERYMLMV